MRALIPALFTGITAGLLARVAIPPRRRLASRLNKYALLSHATLGGAVDHVEPATGVVSGTSLQRLFGPPIASLARALNQVIESRSEQALLLRLRQADLLQNIPESDRVQTYRIRQLATAALGTAVGTALGMVIFQHAGFMLGLALLGFITGATRRRGRIDSRIEERRQRARIELYTINQVLAMRTRVGGGIIQAVQHVADRGHGVVASDLRDALRLHRGGLSAAEAFQRIAMASPEPFAARTYRTLGAAEDRGTDLGEALLSLSHQVREARRDALRRQATKRRAAMLIPIIGIMAPVMLLFIVAPVTELVFGISR